MPLEERLQARLGPAFRIIRRGRVWAVVRRDGPAGLAERLLVGLPAGAEGGYRGRTPLTVFPLPDGGRAVARPYRHGGLLRALTGGWFAGWTRPVGELLLTLEASRRGVPTAEVLGLRLEGPRCGLWRATFVTREVAGAPDLAQWLAGGGPSDPALRRRLARAAGRAVGGLHRAGVAHRDLNLKNVLVRGGPAPAAYILDLDRGHLHPGPLDCRRSLANLRRLDRSAQKLTVLGRIRLSRLDRVRFLRAYLSVHALVGLELRDVVQRAGRRYPLRRLKWRLLRELAGAGP